MLTGALVKIPLRHFHEIETSLPQHQSQVQLAGICMGNDGRIQQVQTARLELQLTSTRKIAQGQFAIRLNNAPLKIMDTEFIAGPGGIVSTVGGLQLQQAIAAVAQPVGTSLLPERHTITGMTTVGFTQHGHTAENDNPDRHVSQIGS